MKVHQITEAPRKDPSFGIGAGSNTSMPKSVDIKPGILDPKGNKIFNVVDQNGKILKSFTGASAEADANAHRDKLTKQITDKRAKIKAPPAPGTPTRDQLSRGQQRKLARTGKITIKGKTYTTKQIAKATVQAKNLSKVKTPDVDNTKPGKTKSSGLNDSWYEKMKKNMGPATKDWMKTHASRLFGSSVAGILIKVFEISGIVSLYNAWFDEINSTVKSKKSNASAAVITAHQKNLQRIRAELVTKTTDLMIGSIAMTFGTSGAIAGGMIVGTAITLLSGGTATGFGMVLNIFFGAMAAMGAYEGALWIAKKDSVGKLLDLETNLYDYTKNEVSTGFLSPTNLYKLMNSMGGDDGEKEVARSEVEYIISLMQNPDARLNYASPTSVPGINSGFGLNQPIGGIIDKVKDVLDHKDHSELNRIMELTGVVQEQKSKKIKLDDLPDDLKKLAILGAKKIKKANKENKST